MNHTYCYYEYNCRQFLRELPLKIRVSHIVSMFILILLIGIGSDTYAQKGKGPKHRRGGAKKERLGEKGKLFGKRKKERRNQKGRKKGYKNKFTKNKVGTSSRYLNKKGFLAKVFGKKRNKRAWPPRHSGGGYSKKHNKKLFTHHRTQRKNYKSKILKGQNKSRTKLRKKDQKRQKKRNRH